MNEAELDLKLVHNLAFSAAPEHLSSSFQRSAFVSWVKENITKKECCLFQRDARDDTCKCGYLKTEHTDEAIKPEDFTRETWDRNRHIHEVPTDAFGDISFGGLGQRISKVI
ncbi:transient receptor potential cation channel subfamily M member 2-like [Kryptolebias marmoratus]|uniref:transient receptor potential cation channel subfamily M member 2-like n=1 Tax=Kryptolebias marmoratus TaxID=37003 RepID=UPI0018ACA900|nr:transient receptor potential cation channel subfamily M member 2-like [Kryptolebias marmoratus]